VRLDSYMNNFNRFNFNTKLLPNKHKLIFFKVLKVFKSNRFNFTT